MNSYQLSFTHRFFYSGEANIIVPILLASGPKTIIPVDAKLDTGSTFSVFQRVYADLLGLEVERGLAQRIKTATGSFLARGHEVTMIVRELEWHAIVYFAGAEDFPINVVGRVGFLDRLRLGLVDYEQVLYLAAYNE